MNKKKFRISAKVNKPCEVEIKDRKGETHALLRLSDGAFCDYLNLAFISHGKDILEKIEARTFLQFDLKHYTNFSLNGNFTDEAGFVEGEFYTGTWEEIVLREIELSLIDFPFFYTCDPTEVKFSVGSKSESHLEVNLEKDGSFLVTSSIKHSTGKYSVVKHLFSEGSDGSEMIRRIHHRLKNLVTSTSFTQAQERDKNKLGEQFNKTISESFIETK